MSKSYYQVLGIEPTATLDEIKKAYRRLARKFHPDLNHANPKATAQMKIVNTIYETLSDPDLRHQYDSLLIREKFSQVRRETYGDPKPREKKPKGSYKEARQVFDMLETHFSIKGNQVMHFLGKRVTFFKDSKNGLMKYVCDNVFYGPFRTYEDARNDCFAEVFLKAYMR